VYHSVSPIVLVLGIQYTVYTFKYYAVVHYTMIMSEGVFGWLVFPRSCSQETMEIETMFLSYSDREGWMFRLEVVCVFESAGV